MKDNILQLAQKLQNGISNIGNRAQKLQNGISNFGSMAQKLPNSISKFGIRARKIPDSISGFGNCFLFIFTHLQGHSNAMSLQEYRIVETRRALSLRIEILPHIYLFLLKISLEETKPDGFGSVRRK